MAPQRVPRGTQVGNSGLDGNQGEKEMLTHAHTKKRKKERKKNMLSAQQYFTACSYT